MISPHLRDLAGELGYEFFEHPFVPKGVVVLRPPCGRLIWLDSRPPPRRPWYARVWAWLAVYGGGR